MSTNLSNIRTFATPIATSQPSLILPTLQACTLAPITKLALQLAQQVLTLLLFFAKAVFHPAPLALELPATAPTVQTDSTFTITAV